MKKMKLFPVLLAFILIPLHMNVSAASVNVALGKPVMASSWHTFDTGTFRPQVIVDGNVASGTNSDGYSLAAEYSYFMIDLLASYKIDKIKLGFTYNTGDHIKNFKILADNDIAFTNPAELFTATDLTGQLTADSVFTTRYWAPDITVSDTSAYRYVKLIKTVLGQTAGFSEVQVYSSDTPAAYTSPVALGAQIHDDIVSEGQTATIKGSMQTFGGAAPSTYFVNWLTPYADVLNNPYDTTKRWKKVTGASYTGTSITVPSNLTYKYLKAVVFPVDSNGTLGLPFYLAPRAVNPSAYVANDLLSLKPHTLDASTKNQLPLINGTDNNSETYWVSVSADGTAYYRVDFAEPQFIHRLAMSPRANNNPGELRNFHIQASNDNFVNDIVNLYSQGNEDMFYTGLPGEEKKTYKWGRDLFPGQPYGSIRVRKIDGDTTALSVTELHLYSYGVPMDVNNAPVAANASVYGQASENGVLTGVYAYSDPDGDAEGATIFSWYRETAANVFEPIPEATSIQYTVTSQDIGKRLKFEVVPKDSKGAAGDAASSIVSIFGDEGVNVAQGKTVMASSIRQGSKSCMPTNLTNSDGAEWISDPAFKGKEWAVIDLAGEYSIDCVKLWCRVNDPNFKNLKITASRDIDFADSAELVADIGSSVSIPGDGMVTLTVSDTGTFRYIKIEKTAENEEMIFKEVYILSRYIPSAVSSVSGYYDPKINLPVAREGDTATITGYHVPVNGKPVKAVKTQWFASDSNYTQPLNTDPYHADMMWECISSEPQAQAFPITPDLVGRYLKAVVYTIDEGNTIGRAYFTPPKMVYPSAAETAAIDLSAAIVTASGEGEGRLAGYIKDGSISSSWASVSGDGVAAPWIQIELPQAARIDRMEIVPRRIVNALETANFKIELANSADFSDAVEVYVQPGVEYAPNSAAAQDFTGFAFVREFYAAGKFKYIRIMKTAASYQGLGMSEIRLYSDGNYFMAAKPVLSSQSLTGGSFINAGTKVTNLTGTSQDAVIVFALYKGNRLENVVYKQMSVVPGTYHLTLEPDQPLALPTPIDGYSVKAMVWDNFENLRPLVVSTKK